MDKELEEELTHAQLQALRFHWVMMQAGRYDLAAMSLITKDKIPLLEMVRPVAFVSGTGVMRPEVIIEGATAPGIRTMLYNAAGATDLGTVLKNYLSYLGGMNELIFDTEGVIAAHTEVESSSNRNWIRDSVSITVGAGGVLANTTLRAKNANLAIEVEIISVTVRTFQDSTTPRAVRLIVQDEDDASCEGASGGFTPLHYLHDTTTPMLDMAGASWTGSHRAKIAAKNKDAEVDLSGGVQNEVIDIEYKTRLVTE